MVDGEKNAIVVDGEEVLGQKSIPSLCLCREEERKIELQTNQYPAFTNQTLPIIFRVLQIGSVFFANAAHYLPCFTNRERFLRKRCPLSSVF